MHFDQGPVRIERQVLAVLAVLSKLISN